MMIKCFSVILIASIAIIIISGCAINSSHPTEFGINTTLKNNAGFIFNVIDNSTGDPVENAIVYCGYRSSVKCYTDSEGKCLIENFVWGDIGLGVYKKEYHRYQEIRHFEKGENTTVIYLEKKTEIPSSSTMQGTVIKIILDKGTRSENIYYKIKTDAGDEEYIFDDIGMNQGFEEFVNKRVNVRGFIDNGFIGWQGEQVNGIYIESIEIV